jgi:chromate transporter
VSHHARLAWIFVRIGAAAFGGLGATLALIETELVRRRKLVSADTLAEALTYTKLLPGSTVVQVVAFLGWRLGGWRASAVCTVAFLVPSVAVMLALAYGYSALPPLPAIVSVRRGVLAAVVGLLLVTTYRVGRPILAGPFALGVALLAFVIGALDVNAALIVLAAGLLGSLRRRR